MADNDYDDTSAHDASTNTSIVRLEKVARRLHASILLPRLSCGIW
jgi:hypothetical protein